MLGAQGRVPGSLEPFLLTRQEPALLSCCPEPPWPELDGYTRAGGGLGAENSGVGLRARQSSQVPGARGQGRGPSYGPD